MPWVWIVCLGLLLLLGAGQVQAAPVVITNQAQLSWLTLQPGGGGAVAQRVQQTSAVQTLMLKTLAATSSTLDTYIYSTAGSNLPPTTGAGMSCQVPPPSSL